ncbi:putative transcription factor Homeodomain-TALE-BEL family [Heracleum sosnowskyi]|uniref:Transcription factor Homeodomain-TALE-BEL family n=1 Tax=Heracleum sosnowskyi TaxID=360622 RepID=A0AAD8IT84_9APIA|nr:putative transcription factor Homeodomain-TALE-BEL family [Heracleum sosnowskyi]
MFYLNQTCTVDSYPKLESGSSLSPKSCDEIRYVGGTERGVFFPLMDDRVSPSLAQQLNMSERVPNNRLTKQQSLSRTSKDCEDPHEQRLSLSLGAELTSSRELPSVPYQFGNSDPLQLINFLIQDSRKLGSPNEKSNTSEFLSFGLTGNTEDITSFGNFNNSDSSRQMQYAQNSFEGSQFAFSNSNYLKGAQQLLDEVVNVYEALKQPKFKYLGQVDRCEGRNSDVKCDPGFRSVNEISPSIHESATNSSIALSNAERLDQDSKLTKLLSLLKGVDTRYKQYYHQMRIVETSFQMIVGGGAAKRYTSLARQTISCQFRCLRDAINRQIQVCRQNLGEQDDAPNSSLLPRLSYVDKQIREQRTLQQLGIMRHSWRPQKGLPESSVSVLRAWLFEHFLNPYPKDSEKSMLARKAGLTRSQVANWFINARVRLWKPMVEDMYKEEFGDLEPEKREEVKESLMSGDTYDDHMRQFNDSKADPGYNLNMNGSTTRLDIKNLPQGVGTIDGEVMSLHGDNWSGGDEHYICPQKFITSNQTSDESLNAIATPYDLSSYGDFTIGNQVSNFALQC